MIRVVLRNAFDADGILLGDYPPSEIGPLRELIATTAVWDGQDDSSIPTDLMSQFVIAGTETPRWVLELIWETPG